MQSIGERLQGSQEVRRIEEGEAFEAIQSFAFVVDMRRAQSHRVNRLFKNI